MSMSFGVSMLFYTFGRENDTLANHHLELHSLSNHICQDGYQESPQNIVRFLRIFRLGVGTNCNGYK